VGGDGRSGGQADGAIPGRDRGPVAGRLRARGELDLDDATAAMLCAMSAATIDRRLPGERKRLEVRGRSGTKPGSLLKSQIPIDHRNKDVRQRTLMPRSARVDDMRHSAAYRPPWGRHHSAQSEATGSAVIEASPQ
jgi:hypothetical protein